MKRITAMGSMTHNSPLGEHDRMQQGYFKTGAMSSILRSSVIGFGRQQGNTTEQSSDTPEHLQLLQRNVKLHVNMNECLLQHEFLFKRR